MNVVIYSILGMSWIYTNKCVLVYEREPLAILVNVCILNVYVNINVEIVASVLEMVDNIDIDPNEFRFDKDFNV